jgi:phosphatidylethanolamine-binding protein (PEBP) family uncharacterized protein
MIKNARDEIRNLVDRITEAHNTNPEHYTDVFVRAKSIDSLTQELAALAREAASQGNEDLGFAISERILNEVRDLKHMWETTVAAEEHALVPIQNGGGMGFDVRFYSIFDRSIGTYTHFVSLPPFDTPLLTREDTEVDPRSSFETEKNRVYVIVMYDNDAHYPARLHFLYTEWLGFGQERRVLIPYEPPNPPQGETHTYTVQLLSKLLPGPDTDIVKHIPNKNGFNIEQFMEAEGLISEAVRTFKVGPA